jgi:hypothetical protein
MESDTARKWKLQELYWVDSLKSLTVKQANQFLGKSEDRKILLFNKSQNK